MMICKLKYIDLFKQVLGGKCLMRDGSYTSKGVAKLSSYEN